MRLCWFPIKGSLIAITAALAGCTTLSPATALHMAQFDPLEADPSQISVAILLPDSLLLHNGDIVMSIKQKAAAQMAAVEQTFKLNVIDTDSTAIENVRRGEGQRLQLAKVSIADAQRLRDLQLVVKEARRGGAKSGGGEFSVAIQGGCRTRPLEGSPLLTSIYIKTDKASSYLPVMDHQDLRKTFGEAVIAKVPACST